MPTHVPSWVEDAVFYQVFPDRFARSGRVAAPGPFEAWDAPPTTSGFKGGDLLGVADHLDHIAALGATAIYLNPVFASASNHRYHTYDYERVDPILGADQALRSLIDAAHARGMRVILDGVFNHSGRGFWPFHHVLEVGANSPYRGWFHLDEALLRSGRQIQAYPDTPPMVDASDPAWQALDGSLSLARFGYRAWWDLPALPKLNVADPQCRAYLLGVAERWLRFGADGWRLDVPEEIRDERFWPEFRQRVKGVDPDAYIVAEIWDIRPDVLRGDRFDGLMNYPLGTAILSYAAGSHLDLGLAAMHATLAANLRRDDGPAFARRLGAIMEAYGPDLARGQLNLLGSHDTPRILSLCSGDRASVRLAMLALATLPGAPCIYYGDEVGLAGGFDPDCRGAFPWQDEAGWDRELLAFVSAVMALRHAEPALRRGSLEVLGADGGMTAYRRQLDGAEVLVVLNAGETAAGLEVSLPGPDRTLEPVALPGPGATAGVALRDGRARLVLPARSGTVLRGRTGMG